MRRRILQPLTRAVTDPGIIPSPILKNSKTDTILNFRQPYPGCTLHYYNCFLQTFALNQYAPSTSQGLCLDSSIILLLQHIHSQIQTLLQPCANFRCGSKAMFAILFATDSLCVRPPYLLRYLRCLASSFALPTLYSCFRKALSKETMLFSASGCRSLSRTMSTFVSDVREVSRTESCNSEAASCPEATVVFIESCGDGGDGGGGGGGVGCVATPNLFSIFML